MANDTSTDRSPAQGSAEASSLRVDLWLFGVMVALALVGVGVTQIEHRGGRLYWLFLVLVYAGISIVRAWQRHRGEGRPLWARIRAQALHWLGTLVAINVVLWFESVDIASRGAAADYSLLILALSCYLAGVHLYWAYLPLSAVLVAMALGLGYLDQLSLFAVVVPLGLLAVWMVARRGSGHTAGP